MDIQDNNDRYEHCRCGHGLLLNRNGLTYIWRANILAYDILESNEQNTVVVRGTIENGTYKNSIIGRPKGKEDHTPGESADFERRSVLHDKKTGQRKGYNTISENAEEALVGLYSLQI
jgi:hypothetical protein